MGIGLSHHSAYNEIIDNDISGTSILSAIFLGQTLILEIANTHHNIIRRNNIHSNTGSMGSLLLWGSHNNTIDHNNIYNNSNEGVLVISHPTAHSNNNIFHHNNFINNAINAYDTCINKWDDDVTSAGNYWSDYDGIDSDGDGRGDTSYFIPGGINQDDHPFMNPCRWLNHPPDKPSKPTGPVKGKAGEEYTYSTTTFDEDDDAIYFKWSFGDGSETAWLMEYHSGEICTINHTWDEKGEYEIKVKAKDSHNVESEWSDPLPISMPYVKIRNPFLFLLFERLMERFPFLWNIVERIV
jgi:hypothetical protein